MKEDFIYEFRLFPTKAKKLVREHACANDTEAKAEARGMMYAAFFWYKHPHIEVYRNGKLIHRMH